MLALAGCAATTGDQAAIYRAHEGPGPTTEELKNDPKNASKPANILEMILEGKLKTWFAENVLVEQPFVKDDKKSVGDLLKGVGVTLNRFIRYRVGEK